MNLDARLRLPLVVGLAALVILGEVLQAGSVTALGVVLTIAIVAGWLANTWRPHPGWVVLLAAGSLGLTALSSGPSGPAPVAGVVLTLIILGRYPTLAGLPAAAVVIAVFVTLNQIHSGSSPLGVAFNLISLSATYGISMSYRRICEEQSRAGAALKELREARRGQVEAAKAAERTRLAREIHDVLAHTLSALAVQLEGARVMAEQRPGDPRTLQALDRAHHLSKDGLDEVRRAVGALRGDRLPGPELLAGMVESFRQDSGVECRLEVEGEPLRLKPDASLAIFRTAQEALTNIRKHSDAHEVTLQLHYSADAAELVVEDRGHPKPSLASGGYGLIGIRERAELLGGSLEAGPTGDGFRVRLLVPA